MPPFDASTEPLDQGRILKFMIKEKGQVLSNKEVIDYWVNNASFRLFFCSLLKETGIPWYVWEMPPLSRSNLDTPFECVLVQIPPRPRHPDRRSFGRYFDPNTGDQGVVTFENLGRDALLVVPSPIRQEDEYIELVHFLSQASEKQAHALWRVLGQSILKRLSDRPLWVSVAGGGVAWLHVRLDSFPKYYRYTPYRILP